MVATSASPRKTGNFLLDRLPHDELARLSPHLEQTDLKFKETLHDAGQTISHVYFPSSGVVSLIIVLADHDPIESGTVGREGMVGLAAMLGRSVSRARAICQIPGAAYRMPTETLLDELAHATTLAQLLLRFTNATLGMLAQSAACNRAHTVEARMARWLLMTRDRVDHDTFPLTQEFLGQMLGVAGPAVRLAGATLQKAGLIQYSRGQITVLDRAGLEDVACECYAVVRALWDDAALES